MNGIVALGFRTQPSAFPALTMTLFPLFAQLSGKPVLVVGGGPVAERKAHSLMQAGARVTVGAPELTPALHLWAHESRISWRQGRFDAGWMDGVWLVIAATSDAHLNAEVARLAEQGRIWANVVDDPALCSFHVPAIVDRAPVTIAISSGGHAPVLARRIREKLETLIDHSVGGLASLVGRYRDAIRHAYPLLSERRTFYDRLIDGPVGDALRSQQPQQAETLLKQALRQPPAATPGKVTLVSAGPGDPGLLTLKALRALNEADVILHDRLVSQDVLDLARRDAERLYVGKTPGENHHQTQARIHAWMVAHASAGRKVVRLKGGDAFIFGRGGEELEVLAAHGIAYEVVPGVTAAIACAAYAGIPLTHRHLSQSLHLLTAHSARDEDQPDWASLARSKQTLGFYMGVTQLPEVARQLIAHGMPADTPFALIENGSRPGQRTLAGRLEDLDELAQTHAMQAPSLLLIGEVVRLSRRLHWFGQRLDHLDEPLALPA